MRILARLIFKGILPGGISRTVHFLRTLPIFAPARIPLVISDWIIGLSMRDYAARNLPVEHGASAGPSPPRPPRAPAAPDTGPGMAGVSLDRLATPGFAETNPQYRVHNPVRAPV